MYFYGALSTTSCVPLKFHYIPEKAYIFIASISKTMQLTTTIYIDK